jgi:Cof subfamily protein (haloacid dehalogenase superfamily)
MIFKKIPAHLIAIDLDGTLLTDEKTINSKTRRYLKRLEKLGHHIVIATGRPVRAIEKYYREIGLNAPVVCYNGACITHPSDQRFPSRHFAFSKEVVKDIYVAAGVEHIDNIMCETNKNIWLLKEDTDLAAFFWHDDMNVIYGDIRTTLDEDPMTMIIKSNLRSDFTDQLLYEAVKRHAGLRIRFWNRSNFSEIYYEHISKGHALEEIATFYGIPKSRTLAFGDAANDIEMLAMAGTSFAMKNGEEEIKQHADFVTRHDNNHDGIYHALRKYFKTTKF